jgi:hypothetical protein
VISIVGGNCKLADRHGQILPGDARLRTVEPVFVTVIGECQIDLLIGDSTFSGLEVDGEANALAFVRHKIESLKLGNAVGQITDDNGIINSEATLASVKGVLRYVLEHPSASDPVYTFEYEVRNSKWPFRWPQQ